MDPRNRVTTRAAGPRVEPAPAAPAARQYAPQPAPAKPRNKFSRKWLFTIIGIIALLALAVGVLSWLRVIGPMTGVKADRYQAVFLTNDQVYFGKVSAMNDTTITLRDVYYLKQKGAADATNKDESSQQVQLAKLGSSGEVHNPDNEMRINRTQILFWENIKDDSQVVKTIKQAQ